MLYSYVLNSYLKGVLLNEAIAIILILIGIFGILMGGMMFGDIGIAAIIGSLAALFSGIGFWKLDSQLKIYLNNLKSK